MVLIASAPGIFRPSGAGTKATLKIFADLIANAAVSGRKRRPKQSAWQFSL